MDQTNLANDPGAAATRPPIEQSETEATTRPALGFVQRRLPWLLAAGALLLYCATLPRWITFPGLGYLARAAGWDWHPALYAPLHYLLTYPCRWLPASLQVIGLNLLGAVCASLTLALLARSVAILPHDRTRDQRQAERGDHSILTISSSWLPPFLAVLVCGLQMTFWENAVVWTGEALDLLLFAYVIRCLLEFRIDPRDSWLLRLAVVYGLAMANNFAMIAFLPAMVIALVWVKGLSVLNFRFCIRMVLCGLAGLSLYLLLPILQSSSDLLGLNFWELLRLNLGFQRSAIFGFRRVVVLMLSFTSLMPILFMGFKWPATFGDISAAGNALTNLMTHVIHGVFLLACLYVAFDPGFSPRKLGMPYPFLPFYFLGALSVGYFSGYFLLVFRPGQIRAWQRPSGLRMGVNWAIVAAVWVAALAVPAGLLVKNLPRLKANLGPALSQYASIAAKQLSPRDAVVLSEEPFMLYAVYGALEQSGARNNKILLESGSLQSPIYHRYLAKLHPRWPRIAQGAKATEPVDSFTLVGLLAQLQASNAMYYLQPSFGYYFERFYLKPHNLVYELKPYPPNALGGPALSDAERNDNVQFWQKMKKEDLSPLLQTLKPDKGKPPEGLNSVVGSYYSRAVDYFGVELQKSGDLERAGECFALALELNVENPSAFINQEYNQKLQTGHPEALKHSEETEKRLSRFSGGWDSLLGWGGPVDEPGMRNELALSLAKGRNFRQAAQQLSRVAYLTPTNIDARVGLADMCRQAGLLDLALKGVADVRATEKKLHTADRQGLLQVEAWAYALRNDMPEAERILREAQIQYPLDDVAYSTLAEIYLRSGRITNAMEVLEKELKSQPENSSALNNLARLKILNQDFEGAVKLLDHALSLDPKSMLILFNRSISNLKSGKLDDAQRDYQTLEAALPKVPHVVYFGLFDVAYKKKNPKTALKYGDLYLKIAPKGTPEYKDVQERINKMKSGSA